MGNKMTHIVANTRGSVINVALLILVMLFLFGVALSQLSTTDIKIARNMKTDTTTFYEAEAGLETMSELLEQNLACALGFVDDDNGTTGSRTISNWIMVPNASLKFWDNVSADNLKDSVAAYDAYYPFDHADNGTEPETTFITAGGVTRYSKGAAIQMAAGYEGLGKGAASGGANIAYDIYARRIGPDNSDALVTIQWIHLIGMGGDCEYGD